MQSNEPVVVIGAGGHGKVVASTLQAAGRIISCFVEDDSKKWGTEILGIPVRGPVSEVFQYGEVAVLGIGQNKTRKKIAEELKLNWVNVVHPTAWVHPSVVIGGGSVVFAGAIIQPDAIIGRHVIVNTGAMIDHDCTADDYSHVAPGVMLAGAVRVGEGVFLGIGSSAVPGVNIGGWTTVGAGAVVVSDLPADAIAVGVPARLRG